MTPTNSGNGQDTNLPNNVVEQLIKISQTSYSISGYPPTDSGWKLTLDQIRDIIKAHSKSFLEDISDVTVEINHKTGAIYGYVWIPSDSKHVCDNDLKQQNSAVNRTLIKYSPKLKEFMDKFCAKDKKRTFPDANGNRLVGMEVMIDAFMKLEFDENGFQFGRKFGDKYKRRTRITLTCNFAKGEDGRFGKFNYLQVVKATKSNFNTNSPKPRRSYNAR